MSVEFYNSASSVCRKKLAAGRDKTAYTFEGLIKSFARDERALFKVMSLLPVETFRLFSLLNGTPSDKKVDGCPFVEVRELYYLVRGRDG